MTLLRRTGLRFRSWLRAPALRGSHTWRVFACAATIWLLPCPSSAREPITIGVLVGDLANPFFQAIGAGVEERAASIWGRNATVAVVSSGYDLTRQIRQIDYFISHRYSILIINAADTVKIADAISRARRSGLIVVAIDARADGAQATVTSDNISAGKMACSYLARRLGGHGRIVIVNGPPLSAIIDRVTGCAAALAQFPGITVLSGTQNSGASLAGGLSSMTALMSQFSRIDAVFAINDPSAIGANMAASQAGRSDFFIVSVDGSPDALETMGAPESRLVATVAQDPRAMAARSVDLGSLLMNGKNVEGLSPLLPVHLITRSDLPSPWVRAQHR